MDRTTYDFNSEKIAPKCRVKSNSEEFGKKKKKHLLKLGKQIIVRKLFCTEFSDLSI